MLLSQLRPISCKLSQNTDIVWFISGVMTVGGIIVVGLIIGIMYCIRTSHRSRQKRKKIQELKELQNPRPKCTKRVTIGIQVKRIFDAEFFSR